MPAAAVIPAPIAYINAAAVKKLVVGSGLPAGTACCFVQHVVCYTCRFGGTASVMLPHVGTLHWSPEPRAGLSSMLLIECVVYSVRLL